MAITPANLHLGISDFITAIRNWRIWCALGIQDILLRYRGSTLGPFWITISTAITVVTMGYLYSILFGIDRATYLPYFTTGLIAWSFISMVVNESTKILLESKTYLENINIPCIVYILRLIFRNSVVLAHNLPVYIVVALIFQIPLHTHILFLIPGMLLLCLNGLFYGTLIAFISSRFPDVGSIVSSLLQVLFFITPIMWAPASLPSKFHIYMQLNPLYYFVTLVRNPLLGMGYGFVDCVGAGILTLLGMVLFLMVLRVYSRRVIFWL